MFIAYDTKFHKKQDAAGSEVCLAVGPGLASLTLRSDRFHVVHEQGSATVTLDRSMTIPELQELATAVHAALDQLKATQQQGTITVVGSGVHKDVVLGSVLGSTDVTFIPGTAKVG
jgi:hypothetical protein